MSRERFDQTLVDELEQELKSALRLEPSSDFAAQVRARIARTSSVASSWRWRMVLAAAAVCIVAAGLGWQARRVAPDVRPETTRVGTDVLLNPTTPASGLKTEEALATVSPKPVRSNRNSLRSSEPEVIVAPEAAHALARFLELLRNGTVDEDTLRPVVAAVAPATLEVAPLVVPPIPVREIVTENRPAPSGAREQ